MESFSFVRILRCVSHCNRIAPGLPRLRDEGDGDCNTTVTRSHKFRAETPSMRKPASKDITSDSVELCESAVCFWHIQLIGTNIRLPKMHKIPPDVDFESTRSPAERES